MAVPSALRYGRQRTASAGSKPISTSAWPRGTSGESTTSARAHVADHAAAALRHADGLGRAHLPPGRAPRLGDELGGQDRSLAADARQNAVHIRTFRLRVLRADRARGADLAAQAAARSTGRLRSAPCRRPWSAPGSPAPGCSACSRCRPPRPRAEAGLGFVTAMHGDSKMTAETPLNVRGLAHRCQTACARSSGSAFCTHADAHGAAAPSRC